MRHFLDNWATQHRNWRAMATGAGFLAILAWGAYHLLADELIDVSRTSAVVEDVTSYRLGRPDGHGGGATFHRGRLTLDDGTAVELPLHPPLPRVGDRVQVIVETYADGARLYQVDWLGSLRAEPSRLPADSLAGRQADAPARTPSLTR